jgi:N-dimethylarginine dimethylaminohydrolase
VTAVAGRAEPRATGWRRRRYAMCPPTYFDVTYSINAWMDPTKPVDRDLAVLQWQELLGVYRRLGHGVDLVPPRPGLPDMVFAANGATVVGGRALVARFRHGERTPESAVYLDWFARHGFVTTQASWVNEGEGDALAVGPWILAGSGFRTERRAHGELEDVLGRPVVGLTLVDERFYHLDTALGIVDDGTVAYYEPAFSAPSRAALRALFPDAILATEADAAVLGLNFVSDGTNVVLPEAATDLAARLRARGYRTIGVDVAELNKAGGGVKCCTLELRTAS